MTPKYGEDKSKQFVLSKEPKARLKRDEDGNLFIDADGINLAELYLLPKTIDEQMAWSYAELSLKTTQNFNRTHPMRTDGYTSTEKMSRINHRTRKRSEFVYTD